MSSWQMTHNLLSVLLTKNTHTKKQYLMKKIITGPPFNAKCLNHFPFFLPPLLSVSVRDMEKGYILSVLLTK